MRYLPLTDEDRRQMLETIGVSGIDDLFRDVPAEALLPGPVDLPSHKGELEVERAMGAMAGRNLCPSQAPSFLGAGIYRHHVPSAVGHLIQRGEFMTAYTPYQPEISQGTLQYLFEFQTQVAAITGMEVANASMYDGATSTAEAVLMAKRVTKRNKAVLSWSLHPHYAEVVETNARFVGIDIDRNAPEPEGTEDLIGRIDDATACVVVQYPNFFGRPSDFSELAEACHARKALLVVVVTEILALGALRSPGSMGADIVVAEGQSLGNAASFGGPTVGLFATRSRYVRQMPGRLVGETVDSEGQRGWVLTLSTREQHIRRDKATSNICTNSGLCALAFTIHLTLLGEAGYRRLAAINHAGAARLADKLTAVEGVEVANDAFFNEFTVKLSKPAAEVTEALAAKGILAGVPVSRLLPDAGLDDHLLLAWTELTTEDDEDALVGALKEALS